MPNAHTDTGMSDGTKFRPDHRYGTRLRDMDDELICFAFEMYGRSKKVTAALLGIGNERLNKALRKLARSEQSAAEVLAHDRTSCPLTERESPPEKL